MRPRKWAGALLLFALGTMQAQAQRWDCQHIQQITFEDCKVLEQLFVDTNGPGWLQSRGWLRSIQPCEWFGVSCWSSAWPRPITGIELSDNNLTGSLPGEVSLLVELRHLIVDNSGPGLRKKKLTGNLSATLGDLSNLEVLVLSDNAFNGTIPPELRHLSKLRVLKLDGNEFTGPVPEQFVSLSALQELNLARNSLAGEIPVELAALKSLRHLDLSGNLLGGAIPAELGDLSELRSLDLSDNDLTGALPPSLARLGSLIRLSLVENQLEGPLPLALATYAASLTSCLMDGNNLCLPASAPYSALASAPVCGLAARESCSVCGGIEDVSSGECRALEAIYESTGGAAWTNNTEWLATLAACNWHGVICDAGVVQGIALNANNLSGEIPPDVSTLGGLRRLDLSLNDLRGSVPASLGQVTSLRHLDLSHNRLTGVVALDVASLGARAEMCQLQDNAGLCMPASSSYLELGADPICGLALEQSCVQGRLVAVGGLRALAESGGTVTVSWQTDGDATGNRFHVEKRSEAIFEELVTVAGSDARTYSYTTERLPEGEHVFRLRQSGPNGIVSVSDEIVVSLVAAGLHIRGPFPNPFRTEATLEVAAGSALIVDAYLYDAAGRQVRSLFSRRLDAHERVSLRIGARDLPSGAYFVRLRADGHTIRTERLLLVR